MAVTKFSKGFALSAVNDSLDQATVGNQRTDANGRYSCRVSSIQLVSGITGGATVIKADGASGTTIFSGVAPASDTAQITFSQPQDINDLTVTTLGTNTVVVVHVV